VEVSVAKLVLSKIAPLLVYALQQQQEPTKWLNMKSPHLEIITWLDILLDAHNIQPFAVQSL